MIWNDVKVWGSIFFLSGVFLLSGQAQAEEERTIRDDYLGSPVQEIYKAGVDFLDRRDYYSATALLELAREKTLLKQVIDKNFRADLYAQLARNYFERGTQDFNRGGDMSFIEQSVAYARQSLEYNPHHWRALYTLARIYRKQRQFEQADYYYSEAEKYADRSDPVAVRIPGEYKKFKSFKDKQSLKSRPSASRAPEPVAGSVYP